MNSQPKIPESACHCGNLLRWVLNPAFPVRMGLEDGLIQLQLSPDLEVSLKRCPVCGGQQAKDNRRECDCGILGKWSRCAGSSILFDFECNEYHLIDAENCHYIFFHCPNCGGILPKSRRGELFVQPSQEEIERLKNLVHSASSIPEIVKLLGVPDERRENIARSARDKVDYQAKDVKVFLRYTRLASTVDLVVQEFSDGTLMSLQFPKQKPR